ncbi:MAG: hypothetical protein ACRDL2_01430 [Gaiellaceae bacterium]
MGQRWWLDNAEVRNAEAPRSFFIPARGRRDALGPGDVVKLIFLFDPAASNGMSGERMWVEVQSATDGRYVGVLLNQPEHITGLKPRDAVTFGPEQVAALHVSEEELGYDIYDYAAVGRQVRDADEFPQLVARVGPSDRQADSDSGWRLAVAEDDGPPEWCDLGWVSDAFPEVEALFRLDVEDGSWQWDAETRSYVATDVA